MGGLQMWTSDGTKKGTVRTFDQTANDLDLDLEGGMSFSLARVLSRARSLTLSLSAMNADWPKSFGIYDESLYYSANVGRGAALLPRGGLTNSNEQVCTGSVTISFPPSSLPPLTLDFCLILLRFLLFPSLPFPHHPAGGSRYWTASTKP